MEDNNKWDEGKRTADNLIISLITLQKGGKPFPDEN